MKLAIIGPNLLDQSKGDFHVHAAGCADTRKAEYRLHRDDVNHPYEIASIQEAVEFVYSDIIGESNPDETWEDYESSLYFFPCTNDLPREV